MSDDSDVPVRRKTDEPFSGAAWIGAGVLVAFCGGAMLAYDGLGPFVAWVLICAGGVLVQIGAISIGVVSGLRRMEWLRTRG